MIDTVAFSAFELLNERYSEALLKNQEMRETLERIMENAESWHGDNEAKARALNVIAGWCRTALERPK